MAKEAWHRYAPCDAASKFVTVYMLRLLSWGQCQDLRGTRLATVARRVIRRQWQRWPLLLVKQKKKAHKETPKNLVEEVPSHQLIGSNLCAGSQGGGLEEKKSCVHIFPPLHHAAASRSSLLLLIPSSQKLALAS